MKRVSIATLSAATALLSCLPARASIRAAAPALPRPAARLLAPAAVPVAGTVSPLTPSLAAGIGVSLTPAAAPEASAAAGAAALAALSAEAPQIAVAAFDGAAVPAAAAAAPVPAAEPASAPSHGERLRAISLLPVSEAALKDGLRDYLELIREAVSQGGWPQIEEEARAQMAMLVGMLEFLKKALDKDVKPCRECVSQKSCARVDGGKDCAGCVGGVNMDAAQTAEALKRARAVSRHLQAPTERGLRRLLRGLD